MKANKALLMIEFQNDWLSSEAVLNGYMKDRPQLESSIVGAKRALGFARKNDWHIIHIGYHFKKGYPEFGSRETGMWGLIKQSQTFLIGSRGSEYHADFAPTEGEFEVSGRTGVNAFSGSNLDNYLRNHGLSEIYLAGYAMHACVESTFRAAHDLGYIPTVISDASATFSAEMKQHFLENIVYAFGNQITSRELS